MAENLMVGTHKHSTEASRKNMTRMGMGEDVGKRPGKTTYWMCYLCGTLVASGSECKCKEQE